MNVYGNQNHTNFMNKKIVKRLALSFLLLVGLGQPVTQAAESYPSAPIKVVVPFGAGSATDILARTVGERMSKELGTPFVVENKAGALGTIGATYVARSAPDGYTLLVGTNTTNAAIKAFMKSAPYDPLADFVSVSLLGELTQIVVVSKDSQFQTLEDLVKYANTHPGKLTYAWSNTVGRVASEMLAQHAGIKFMDVPYKEAGTALMDVVSGRVDFTIDNAMVTSSQINGKNLRPLAVTSAERLPMLPETPTVREAIGLENYMVKGFFALFAPAGTPPDIVEKLSNAVQVAGKDEQVRNKLSTIGFEVGTTTPGELQARIEHETASWLESARLAGIEPQ